MSFRILFFRLMINFRVQTFQVICFLNTRNICNFSWWATHHLVCMTVGLRMFCSYLMFYLLRICNGGWHEAPFLYLLRGLEIVKRSRLDMNLIGNNKKIIISLTCLDFFLTLFTVNLQWTITCFSSLSFAFPFDNDK